MPQPHPHPVQRHLSHPHLDKGGRHPAGAEESFVPQLDFRCVHSTTPPRELDDLGLTPVHTAPGSLILLPVY